MESAPVSNPPPQKQHSVRVHLTPLHPNGPWREDADLVCLLNLRVEVEPGRVVPIEFRVDTGSSRTLVPMGAAEAYGLPIPDGESERIVLLNSSIGWRPVRVRDGRIRVWWDVGRRGEPFDWPALFILGAPAGSQPLLGLGGVIRDCQWVFDGHPEDDAVFGTATFHDIRSF